MATARQPTDPPVQSFGLLAVLGTLALVAMTGAAIIGVQSAGAPQAVYLMVRVAVIVAVFGGAAVLCRVIAGELPTRLLAGRWVKGDFGVFGLLAGLYVLVGQVVPALQQEKKAREGLGSGQVVEITGPTLDGGHFDLTEHRGKVVLIDFWATWCGPCIRELPNVEAVYNEFHDQGLVVASISLDVDRAALVKFLQARPLPWTQIFFDPGDEAGQRNHPARRYGVDGIPFLVVIDREGKLAAQGVRGEEIRSAVAQALGLSTAWGDRVAAAGTRLLFSILSSPLWLVLVCVWGGAFLAAFAERTIRRAFRRQPSPMNA
jgi:thiol-disulfide isomerase/thioredoxin